MKRALVLGAGGFIGSHLCRRLKNDGWWVRGLSRSPWDVYTLGSNPCNEFWPADLRERKVDMFRNIDVVFQLASEVGGLGYIMDRTNDRDCLRNSTMIDLNVLEACEATKVKQVFFASSGCVYNGGSGVYAESDAIPANPMNEFAWQKVFAERLYQSYAKVLDVRIGRLFNTYGPGMPWTGGREKSIAALCRKVVECEPNGSIGVWGDGTQARDYMFVHDTVDGILRLMKTDTSQPVNIGSGVGVSIRKILNMLAKISGKTFTVNYVDGPVGVRRIVADTTLFSDLTTWVLPGINPWALEESYRWVEKQVLDARTKT